MLCVASADLTFIPSPVAGAIIPWFLSADHEIIGKVPRVGPKVDKFKPGQCVGVEAQVQPCMKCQNCKSDNENYCPHMVGGSFLPRLETGC
jgi:D-arabinose 1-dehydrogenase-like Zn-dependent alcohol dehydrogenase